MMKILKGYPIASGLGAGKISVIRNVITQISSEKIAHSEVETHLEKFDKALKKSIDELQFLSSLLESGAKEERDILLSHQEMLKDTVFAEETMSKIENELMSAEYAVHSYFEKLIAHLSQTDDEYLAQRKEDLQDIRSRIIRNLGEESVKVERHIPSNRIVVVEGVSPSFVLNAKNSEALGIIAERGAPNSHSAIIAKSIGVPVVFDIKNALGQMHNDDFVILNGTLGTIILNPDAQQIANYKKVKEKERQSEVEKVKISKLPAVTNDNQRIQLMGNIEFPEEAKKVELQHADGIGLFRTEFLYFTQNIFPPAQKQFEIYRGLIDSLPKDKPIYIRTFDIGGDKLNREFGLERELNPYLGCRGIRFSLKFPKIFKEQIKGILQASAYGNLKIMIPMISTAEEVIKAKKIIMDVKNTLKRDGILFNDNIEIGIMIEVPSAALRAKELADVSDFFSIGTNDLTQYVLAADRNNESLSAEFNYFHPAVLQLIEMSINAAKKRGIHISLCGEMAGDPIAVPLLLGMGLRIFSVNADSILKIKKNMLHYNLKDLQENYIKIKDKNQGDIRQFYTEQLNRLPR
jgi:phosphotransferase system enzyme I (PtsI)